MSYKDLYNKFSIIRNKQTKHRISNKLNIKNICEHSNGGYCCYITKDKISYNKYFKNLDKAKEWIKNMERKLYGLQRTVH